MENIGEQSIYYNEAFKDTYFRDLRRMNNETAINPTRQLFNDSKDLEESLGRDLYSFSFEEVIDLIRNLNGKERGSVGNRMSMLSTYLTYCVTNEKIKNNIFDKCTTKDLIDAADISFKYKYLTRKMVYQELLPKLNSYQDKAMIVLLFENIAGSLEELTNIKMKDINFVTKTLVIKRNDELKYIQIDDIIADILFKAIQETKINTLGVNKRRERELKCSSTQYLLRFAFKSNNPDGKLDNTYITNRFNKLTKYIKTYYKNDKLAKCCNARTLTYSGLFEKLLKKSLNPSLKDYNFIMGNYTANKATSIGTLLTKFAAIKSDEDFKRDYEEYYLRDGEIPVIENEKFVQDKTDTGLWGEQFIHDDLAVQFGKDKEGQYYVQKERAKVGYDLSLFNKYCLEVKTSAHGFPDSFHVSITELKRANSEKDNYFIVLVEKNDMLIENVKLIRNPIETLGIEFKRLVEQYESVCDCCVITQENFHIRLNNENLKTISYMEFIELVNKEL